MHAIKLAVVGAGGRMGRSILENAQELEHVEVVAAIEHPGSEWLGKTLHGVTVTGDLSEQVTQCTVIIDFSSPEACVRAARIATEAGVRFVSGTTGLGVTQLEQLNECSRQAAVLHAANFSVGVNILERLVELASRSSGSGFDLEVFEAHHRRKVDAPSGTALFLGEAAARGRGQELEQVAAWARHGQVGARADDEIGFQVVRGGDIVGEHTVFLCGEGERLELTHRATDRGIFARGALRAAGWLSTKHPGSYSMSDMLFGH